MQNKGDQSKFMSSAEQMKEDLGPALCLAKWKQVSLHLPTGLTNSCYHPPLHKIPIENLAADPGSLHNTPHKKAQRVLMLQNEKPAECEYCWNMEAENKLSDRHYRSGEPWAAVDFEKIKNSTGEENDVIPSYVEVNFNNVCNLMCSYCSPQFSSSWQQEVDRSGGYPTARVHNNPGHFGGDRRVIPVREHNPYVEAFWEWWPTLYPELVHFRMTGGEPLLDKNTYRVFDHVLVNPSAKLHLNVTSNFSVDEKSWQKYLGYVKQLCDGRIEHFMQYVSLDGWGSQAEYMRHGLDFDLLWRRVDQFLTEVPSYNSLTFIVTMNNLSVTSLQKLLQGILDLRQVHSKTYQRVWFDTPVLREPAWQSLKILPESYAQLLSNTHSWMMSNLETTADP
jgi:organic radical activating enzyme